MTPEQKLKFARTILPTVEPFYGSLVFNARTEFVDEPGTAWTDGKTIKFSREFAEELTREEFTGVLLHEVLHVAYLHIPRLRSGGLNPMKWNYATDYVINLQIQKLTDGYSNSRRKDIILPKGCLYDAKFEGMSAEQVYALLPDSPSSPSDSLSGDLQKEQVSGEELQQAAEEWRGLVAQAANQARMRGTLPAGADRELHDLLYPKIDWRERLKQFLQTFPIDYDYMHRDRRFLNSRVIIPSLTGERLTGVLAIDTSGSINEDEVRQFMSEVYSVVESFARVDLWVLCCDTEVLNPQQITSRKELEGYQLKGGGGTRFEPVFEWVETETPGASFVVYFTDGHGSFGDVPEVPTLWVMTTDIVPPYGNHCRL